jgi:phospholipid-binding lipoprotein MlaA
MKKSHNDNYTQRNLVKHALTSLALGLAVELGGCASTNGPSVDINKADPYENINRKVYSFNDKVDSYLAKPIADAYKTITPDFMETGVSNFFNNLKTINVVLNDVLQAKFNQSGRDTGRFLMNSTLGLAGVFDVAKSVGLEQNDEDFEQTLAVWGVPQGSYVVLPLLGPITTRGIPGAVFDTAANPASYVGAPIQVLSLINTRANAEGALKFIDEAALDPYVFTRESFLQWRGHLANDGKTDSSSDSIDIDAELLDDDKSTSKKANANNSNAIGAKMASPSSTLSNKEIAPASAANNKNTLKLLPPDSNNSDKVFIGNTQPNLEATKKAVVTPPKN